MDRSIILYEHDLFDPPARLGAIELIELLEMRREVTATLRQVGMDDELARYLIERTQDGPFFSLSRLWQAQIGA
jgi:hypothetical protein